MDRRSELLLGDEQGCHFVDELFDIHFVRSVLRISHSVLRTIGFISSS